MPREHRSRFGRVRTVGVAAVVLAAAALLLTPLAAKARPPVARDATGGTPPAFYTWQAPGGASTAGRKVIALTFDDGPGPYTPQVLSVLRSDDVPATFFEIGRNVAAYPKYTKMLAAAGYPVEDHTWSHPDLATVPASQYPSQIDRTQNEIASLTGQEPSCLRPPYNDWNAAVLGAVAARGLTTMSYSVDPRDWALPGADTIVSRTLAAAFPGAVVDLHDGGGPRDETVAALPGIISGLRARGYSFVSLCPPLTYAGAVRSYGAAAAPGRPAVSRRPIVGMATDPATGGYWLVASDGGVFAYDAPFYGSMGATPLNQPVVGMASTADGRGYWLVAADGGIFSYGDAVFHGSAGALPLRRPIVGMATDPATGGYWLVASDGGVFSYGAPFYGSAGGSAPPEDFTTIAGTDQGRGYLLAGSAPTP